MDDKNHNNINNYNNCTFNQSTQNTDNSVHYNEKPPKERKRKSKVGRYLIIGFLLPVLVLVVSYTINSGEPQLITKLRAAWGNPATEPSSNPTIETDASSTDRPVSDPESSQSQILNSIPFFSQYYPPQETDYTNLSSDEFLSYAGPGTTYVQDTWEKAKCANNIIRMFFREDGYVLTSMYYEALGHRIWTYIPERFVDNSMVKKVKPASDITGYPGKINRMTYPIWAPDVQAPSECDWYRLEKGTQVKVYFKEDNYVLAEFYSASKFKGRTGTVQMWLPIDAIDF